MSAGCKKKLQQEENYLLCSKCNTKFPQETVRYKVIVRVLDKTGDAPFLLLDREVAELVGIPASVLYEKSKKVNYRTNCLISVYLFLHYLNYYSDLLSFSSSLLKDCTQLMYVKK